MRLHPFSVFFVTSSEVRVGLVFSALKRQQFAKFSRAEPKPFEIEKLPFGLLKTDSLGVIGEVILFEYLDKKKKSRGKGK